MATNAVLSFGGDPEGESRLKGFEKSIEVFSWQWGVSADLAGQMAGSARGSGRAVARSMVWTHRFDLAAVPLIAACAAGRRFPKATLTVLAGVGSGASKPMLVIEMSDVVVEDVSNGYGGDAIDQSVSMQFEKIVIDYKMFDARSGTAGAGRKMAWDIAAAQVTSSNS